MSAQTFTGEPWNIGYSAQALQDAAEHQVPYIDATTKHWLRWDIATGAYKDTGITAEGQDGEDGEVTTAQMNATRAMLAPVETTSTASRAYAVGDLLIYEGVLREVTAAIALGDALAVGTNLSGNSVTCSEEVFSRLAAKLDAPTSAGTDGQVLTLADGVPTWADAAGGILPQVIVTTAAGASVTATLGGVTVGPIVADENGKATLDLPNFGEWTITGDDDEVSVNVDTVMQYNIDLGYPQIVNYIMLYDGSLGEAGADGANVCKDVTGGWTSAYTFGTHEETYESSYFKARMRADGGVAGPATVNKINCLGYSAFFAKTSMCGESAWSTANKWSPRFQLTTTIVSYGRAGGNRVELTNLSEEFSFGSVRNKTDIVSLEYQSDAYLMFGPTEDRIGYCTLYFAALLKNDDWESLCEKAEVSAPASLSALLTDNSALTTIMSNRSAVNFMVRRCTGSFMGNAVQSSSFLAAYAASPYKTVIDANEHWAKFLAMAA